MRLKTHKSNSVAQRSLCEVNAKITPPILFGCHPATYAHMKVCMRVTVRGFDWCCDIVLMCDKRDFDVSETHCAYTHMFTYRLFTQRLA